MFFVFECLLFFELVVVVGLPPLWGKRVFFFVFQSIACAMKAWKTVVRSAA